MLITEVFPPCTGGSGRWFHQIYRRLPREQFVVAAGERPAEERANQQSVDQEMTTGEYSLRIERVPLSLRAWGLRSWAALTGYRRAYLRLARLIRQERITALHCARMLPEGWLAWLLNKRYGLPYTVYVHGEETSYGVLSRELGWMMRRVLAGAKQMIANSHNTARILRDDWHVAESRIKVLHPGTDTSVFVPAASDSAARRRLGWEERLAVVTVGRLQRRKGHDMFLRAMPALQQQFPNLLYVIIGDGDERANLKRLVDELGLGDAVQFRGELDDAQLVECYQQADLFVLPNRDINGDIEGFGIVLLEAQACGLPVIAGESGGTAETMSVGETGLIVPCNEPGPLAAAVAELLSDGQRRERMGAAGRHWVASHFAWEALAAEAAELFGTRPRDLHQPATGNRSAEAVTSR